MKNLKLRILSVLLANLILFNSFGFGLVEHSCSMRGKKTYSFIAKESCKGCDKHQNKHAGKTVISKAKCCEDKHFEQENISESIVNITSKFVKSTAEFIVNSVVWLAKTAFLAILNVFDNQPNNEGTTAFSGKKLLIFISLFRL